MKILVTGGAGFIGSNFIRMLLTRSPREEVRIVNFDKLTYAGNLENLADIADDPRYAFVHADIADPAAVEETFARERPDWVVNFAAESHVDRSIGSPGDFLQTDIFGTFTLLEASRKYEVRRYLQVSTDEVYGSVETGSSREDDLLNPSSPYSSSKASADLLVRSYHVTYGLPVLITRASNNFGPYQYPEKVLPLFISNAIDDLPLPLYGDGRNVRDWLFVVDHCTGIETVLRKGQLGEIYNIGGGNERENIDVTRRLLQRLGKPESLIRYVTDRPGHDRRYSVDCAKLKTLGWSPRTDFDAALGETIDWYVEHESWWRKIKSGEYRKYYEEMYGKR